MNEFFFTKLENDQISFREHKAKVLSNYYIGDCIGEGSYAKVKEGVDRRDMRHVALKIFCPKYSIGANGDDILFKIEREIEISKSLFNEFIVSYYEHFVLEDDIYLVMEYLNAGSLNDLLESNVEISMYHAKRIFVSIMNAVDYLQSLQIVHRDIKPDNVLLDTTGSVKLADFGASVALTNNLIQSRSFVMEGSYAFHPPECQNSNYDIQTSEFPMKFDVWSCGILLFIMTIGFYPFEAPNLLLLLDNISHARYTIPDGTDEDLANLITNILNIDANLRLSCAEALEQEWCKLIIEKDELLLKKTETIFSTDLNLSIMLNGGEDSTDSSIFSFTSEDSDEV